MKRCVPVFLLILSILSLQLTLPALAAANPDEEIASLRKIIRTVDDIDTEKYNRLEAAILKKYTDVRKDGWYMSVMVKLVGLGALDGSLQNTLDPGGTVTRAMFIKLFIRAMYGEDGVAGITPDFEHWAARDIKKAEQVGILAAGEYTLDNISEPVTRGEMAKLITRAYRQFEDDPLTYEECKPLASKIKDFAQVPPDKQPGVLITYASGIISGYTDGRYGANDTATRAQASAFIIRYLDKRERAEVKIQSNETRAPMTLRYDDPHRPMAIEGDTFIKPDGTAVVLKRGPSGVLGEEQGVATEIGRAHPNGELIQHGHLGSNEEFLGQPYLVDKKTGEGHYQGEWDDIAQSQRNRALKELGHPKDGTTYGPWLRYEHGQWLWTGPVR